MCSVTLHYPCVREIRCKQPVMSEVRERNENVNRGRKLLNGTNCLRGVFVYPCAACLPQSIIRKDKPPGGMSVLGRQGGWQGPAPTAQGNSTHIPSPVSSGALSGIWLLSVGRSRNRQARGLLAFRHCDSTNIRSWVSVDGKHP